MKDEPAFPTLDLSKNRVTGETVLFQTVGGLTKREYFTAMAMQGLVAQCFTTYESEASRMAVLHADALIAALEKK